MAMAAHVLDMPTQLDYHLGLIANANSTSAMIEAVQKYLASWSMERIAKVQKIDAGWAPFDLNQCPLQVNGALDVRCIRDAIHCHCMALRESSVPPTPELVELEEFFFAANEMVESSKRSASADRRIGCEKLFHIAMCLRIGSTAMLNRSMDLSWLGAEALPGDLADINRVRQAWLDAVARHQQYVNELGKGAAVGSAYSANPNDLPRFLGPIVT